MVSGVSDVGRPQNAGIAVLTTGFALLGRLKAGIWIVLAHLCICSNGYGADTGENLANESPLDVTVASMLRDGKTLTVGEIQIANSNIFDETDPLENRRLYRWANALHIKTRPRVIRAQLLFDTDDTYSQQVIDETERLLRSNPYLHDADIVPISYANGVVDLEVQTTDVWTLDPSISFGRGGGKNSGGIGLKDQNLLGSGTSIGIKYKSNVDRDTLSLKYFDRNLRGSRYRIGAIYADASDGYTTGFELGRPFFALDTRRAGGISLFDQRRTESVYDRGDVFSQYEHSSVRHEAYYGWSSGLQGNWTRRYLSGVHYDSHEFGPAPDDLYPSTLIPENRRFAAPFVGIEIVQNDFATTRNFDQMNRTEDRYFGTRAALKIGYASQSFGSLSDAWLIDGYIHRTLFRKPKSTLVASANFDGRIEDGTGRNVRLSLSARYDNRQSEKRLFHTRLAATVGSRLDIDNTTYLGGDNGLRGYPLRYQSGDKSLLLTVEQRLFTDWYPFRLFNIGGAVFFDAGRTWGPNPADGKNLGWLRDIGIGLRIGNTRSGVARMFHIDLAYPLDGESDISKLQFLVEAKSGF